MPDRLSIMPMDAILPIPPIHSKRRNHYNRILLYDNMALRDVKPFDKMQMVKLQDNLKAGATPEQIANLKRAQEHVAKANPKSNF
jgi:hypothetical protein